jgi:hypothetical protein
MSDPMEGLFGLAGAAAAAADPIQALLGPGARRPRPFPDTSRYATVPAAVLPAGPGGRPVAYLMRRIVPQPDRFTAIGEHLVVDGDRLDAITARYLTDPEQFWRLCDANGVLRPEELEVRGRRIRITLPEGVQGVPV